MNNVKNHSLIVITDKGDSNYNKFKTALTEEVKNKLRENKIEVYETFEDGNKFALYLYGMDGILYGTMSTFDDTTMSKIFEAVTKLPTGNNNVPQKGGAIDYKKKYYKYKNKYFMMKKVVTKLI